MRSLDLRTILILGLAFGAILAGIIQGLGEAIQAVKSIL